MSDDTGRLRRTMHRIQHRIDGAKRAVERRFDLFEPLEILTYRSHGRPDSLRIIGRLVEETGVDDDGERTGLVRNFINTIRRFESDEIPDARLVARFDGAEAFGTTDFEGFFDIELEPPRRLGPGWHQVEVELLESMAGQAGLTATAEVLIPSPAAEFAVVSDMDDTVIRTTATDKLMQARILMSNSATTHSPMPGAAPLYRALHGPEGRNPFFYVSRSGWGLYDLFEEFLDHHELPKGALFLRDVALVEPKSPHLGSNHPKRDTIYTLMDEYPDLRFVLIGDSGQDDPETYRDIVRERADRVRAVLVRDVTPIDRDREVRRIVQEVQEMGVPMAAAESSVSLARAAADFELIPHEAIDEVRTAMIDEETEEVGD